MSAPEVDGNVSADWQVRPGDDQSGPVPGAAADDGADRSAWATIRSIGRHDQGFVPATDAPRPAIVEWSDVDLTNAIQNGSHEALAEVYRRHAGEVFAAALRVSGDLETAGDVVQDVFVRLWAEPGQVNAASVPLAASLRVQGRSRAVDLLRSGAARRRRQERHAGGPPAREDDVAEVACGRTAAGQVRRAVAALPAREREAIGLAYYGGFSYREVARILRVPEGTIKARIRLGLHRLRVARPTRDLDPR